jgi:hypothetical protein
VVRRRSGGNFGEVRPCKSSIRIVSGFCSILTILSKIPNIPRQACGRFLTSSEVVSGKDGFRRLWFGGYPCVMQCKTRGCEVVHGKMHTCNVMWYHLFKTIGKLYVIVIQFAAGNSAVAMVSQRILNTYIKPHLRRLFDFRSM